MPPTSSILPRTCEEFGSRALSQLQSIASKAASGTGRQTAPAKADTRASLSTRLDFLTQRLVNLAGGTLAAGAGTAAAMARSGFSGTVEGAQFGYAMEQLSRQLAAVFQPVIQGMTYTATRLTGAMQNMSGTGQNRLMYGAIGTLAGLALGGPRGALMGGGMGLGLSGGDVSLLGVGSAAWAGYRLGGPGGAMIGAGAALAATVPDRKRGESLPDYYGRMRDEGASRFGTAMRGIGKMIDIGYSNTIGRLFGSGEKFAPDTLPPPTKRREVTPFQNEMGAAGSTYFKLQEAVIRTTAGEGADAGPFKPLIDLGLEIIRLLGKIAGVDVKYTDPEDAVGGTHVGLMGMFSGIGADLAARLAGGK